MGSSVTDLEDLSVESDTSGYKRFETKRLEWHCPEMGEKKIIYHFHTYIIWEVWIMQTHTSNYKIEVTYKTREETERRHVVSRKLVQIINLSAGSAAVR